MKFILSFFIIIFTFILPAAAEDKKINVVASFSIIADIAQNIGGEYAEVISFVPPEVDAHSYEPTPKDVQKITKADLVIINGIGFEPWFERLSNQLPNQEKVITATRGVEIIGSGKNANPHCWHDVRNVKIYASNIAQALIKTDPKRRVEYESNLKNYQTQLDNLDKWVREKLAEIPKEKRKVITSHDAFGYYAKAYGVEFSAPKGGSTANESSAKEVSGLIDKIKQEKIKRLFIEDMSGKKLMSQIAEETQAAIGGQLYADFLSKPEGSAPDYLNLMSYNTALMAAGMNVGE